MAGLPFLERNNMYTVRVYKSTGYDAVNIPDTPAKLDTQTYLDLPSIDTLQERFLTSIKVKATWSEAEDIDYCRVGTFYYAVTAVHMVATDTAELDLSADYILSAGGAGNLEFIDGVTERVCVAVADDTYGAYVEDDELLAPAKSMEIVTDRFTPASNASEIALCEATVDLYNTGDDTQIDATEYSTPLGTASVTVPNFVPLSAETEYEYGGKVKTGVFSMSVNGTTYPAVVAQLNKGMERVRGLGVESSITAMYAVPELYIDSTDRARCKTDAFQPNMDGVTLIASLTQLPYENAGTVKNHRIEYSEATKYGLLTMAGNKCEFPPYQVYEAGATSPHVVVVTDVRPDGCPYFRFKQFLGESGTDTAPVRPNASFWRNCLAGAPWKQVPLLFSQKSGNALDRLQYETENRTNLNKTRLGMGASVLGGVMEGASKGGAPGAVAGLVTGAVNAGAKYAQYEYDKFERGFAYSLDQIKAPDLNFPYNGNIMRDALGNGVIAYRYKYDSADVARIDKLLTMYGYRVTKNLETTDFTNRPKFNYVKADGARVTGKTGTKLPRWWNDGIATQLSRGVRVWHVAPDPAIYSTGNI